jgi:hypothetical protein
MLNVHFSISGGQSAGRAANVGLRPIPVVQITSDLHYSMILLAFVGLATMLSFNSGHKEANPCHFLKN